MQITQRQTGNSQPNPLVSNLNTYALRAIPCVRGPGRFPSAIALTRDELRLLEGLATGGLPMPTHEQETIIPFCARFHEYDLRKRRSTRPSGPDNSATP